MITRESLHEYARRTQTDFENAAREYCQHTLLSSLYREPGAERLLFKGGTALRILYQSPRFSEDLDFTGTRITQREVETLLTNTLVDIEHASIPVEVAEGKNTSGGYLGIVTFAVYGRTLPIHLEVSLRAGRRLHGERSLIASDLVPAYTLVHLPVEELIAGKLAALYARKKPRDFYDYFFLLSGNYPLVKEPAHIERVLKLLRETRIDFRTELKKFLPASHSMHLRDFKGMLERQLLRFRPQRRARR